MGYKQVRRVEWSYAAREFGADEFYQAFVEADIAKALPPVF